MVTGETKSGFKFEIDPDEVNDIEFLERLGEAGEDVSKMPRIMKEILGEDQRKRMYDHIRNEKGKVPIDTAMDIFTEILTIANEARETKNS